MADAFELEFSAMISKTFGGENEKVKGWLLDQELFSTKDFGLLAKGGCEVTSISLPAAEAKGIPTEAPHHIIAFKKLWKICKSEDVSHVGLADTTEADTGLCGKTRKSCEFLWQRVTASFFLLGECLSQPRSAQCMI